MANPKIQLRHDTALNWDNENPVLLEGELGIETDTNKIKIGDGTNPWRDLGYVQGDDGGQSASYLDLTNKPSINGITLTGNKTSADLGLVTLEQYGATIIDVNI